MFSLRTALPVDRRVNTEDYYRIETYPNPFNPTIFIPFYLPFETTVKIEVYNLLGQHVSTLLNRNLTAGKHQVIWQGNYDNGMSASSGAYFIRLETPQSIQSQKIVMLK